MIREGGGRRGARLLSGRLVDLETMRITKPGSRHAGWMNGRLRSSERSAKSTYEASRYEFDEIYVWVWG